MDLHPGPEKRRVTQVKLTESDPIRRALQENEDWHQDLLEHSQDLLCIHDLEGRLLSVNPAQARVLGYSVEEILRIPMWEIIAPEFRPQFDAYLKQIASVGESRGLMAVMTRSGARRIWEYHNTLRTKGVASPIVRGMARDVTEQKRAEKLAHEASEALVTKTRESEHMIRDLKLFRTLVDQSNDAVEVVDPQTLRFLDANEKACAVLGYSREELLSLRVFDIDPNVTEVLSAKVIEELEKSGYMVMESIHRRKDGSTFPVEVSMRRVQLERDYVVTIARDLTERKRAEALLRTSEDRYRAVHELSPVGICWVETATGRFLAVNPKYCEIAGRTEQGLLERDFQSIIHPDDLVENLEKLRQLGQGETPHYRTEKRYLRPDGSVRWVQVAVVSTGIEGEKPAWHMAMVEDITERRRAEEALRLNVAQLQEVTEELRRAKEKLSEEKLYLEEAIDTELGFGEIIGHSNALKEVMQKVARVAPVNSTVLLLGETGTGKELVARALHRMSQRVGNSFIKVNCAAIPSGLLESELFGHEKGAFTDAVSRKLGRLELADRGTLFLDEIGEIPLSLQPKLLRVLEDMEFERLGGTLTLKVDCRLLAATNRDLQQGVKAREFRSDLYYRLNVFPILIPPLRERREDIPPLVEHFVRKCADQMKKSITSIPSRTMEMLVRWDWPGNIRELENFVERSVILTPASVLQAPLSELQVGVDEGNGGSGDILRDRERERILRALRDCHGKLGGPDGAAAHLGLKRTTLQSKLGCLGIKPGAYRA